MVRREEEKALDILQSKQIHSKYPTQRPHENTRLRPRECALQHHYMTPLPSLLRVRRCRSNERHLVPTIAGQMNSGPVLKVESEEANRTSQKIRVFAQKSQRRKPNRTTSPHRTKPNKTTLSKICNNNNNNHKL
jgi:hypothetical protein